MIHLARKGGKGLAALGTTLGLLAALAPPVGAAVYNPGAFTAVVTGGEIEVSPTQGSNSLGALPQCADGADNEAPPPWGTGMATPLGGDGLTDYPADAECASVTDNDEATAGDQPAVPITVSGSIDGAGVVAVPASGFSWPSTSLYSYAPPPAVPGTIMEIATSVSQPLPWSGVIEPADGTGSMTAPFTLSVALDFSPDVFVGFEPIACDLDIAPDLSTEDAGSTSDDEAPLGRRFNAGKGQLGNTDFAIGAPAGPSPLCPAIAPAFGLPTYEADLGIELTLGSPTGLHPVDPEGGTISIGDVRVVESDGATKATFTVTADPAPGAEVTFLADAVGGTPPDLQECLDTLDNDSDFGIDYVYGGGDAECEALTDDDEATAGFQDQGGDDGVEAVEGTDFKAVDAKTIKLKAGKTSTKVSVTVYGDDVAEGDERLRVELSSPPMGYSFGDSVGQGIIIDDDELPACSDGVDNDGDSGIDFGVGPGFDTECASATDNDEAFADEQSGTDVLANSVSIGDVQVYEGDLDTKTVKASVPISLNGVAAGTDIYVEYCIASPVAFGSATAGTDYKASCVGKTKRIKVGKSSTTVSVQIYQGSGVEGTETPEVVDVLLTDITGGTGATIADDQGRVTIVSDDL